MLSVVFGDNDGGHPSLPPFINQIIDEIEDLSPAGDPPVELRKTSSAPVNPHLK